MHSTVQGHAVMNLVVSQELSFRIVVDLDYDPVDPFAVRCTFHLPGDEPVTWVFARELLLDGISRPTGEGDVHIHPVGEELSEVCIVLHSPDGDALLRASAPPLIAFLARTDRLVPMGQELTGRELDDQLADILSRGCENLG
ncbi:MULTISPECIES: SsgA family sporulation/cell division regulator [unclassified Kitasatospora]|uniref:SsgA family sporulation/cell division regulator n=1 Tax=unclassified Kitasatospora TaxID=2633591 RepID=UPI00070988F2|nr:MULTISPECIES: SsgA family sporulation/cell division regulator [unclassified Kitasatospora]KQV22282.1 regulator [Kitasatospora sp. Root107]KRB64678.1 regulator [Kitasatospora sp. Root187]